MNQTLTQTEDRIVRLMINGYQRKEIARQMKRSTDTVSVHFRNIHHKTNVQSEIELYTWYLEHVLQINIKKILQISVLLLILSPSIISHDNNIQRARRTNSSRSIRSSRRSESDYNLIN
ncbi:MAG: LuxR C-terminal-related transcriptional regulator [Mariniphaga sp.]